MPIAREPVSTVKEAVQTDGGWWSVTCSLGHQTMLDDDTYQRRTRFPLFAMGVTVCDTCRCLESLLPTPPLELFAGSGTVPWSTGLLPSMRASGIVDAAPFEPLVGESGVVRYPLPKFGE